MDLLLAKCIVVDLGHRLTIRAAEERFGVGHACCQDNDNDEAEAPATANREEDPHRLDGELVTLDYRLGKVRRVLLTTAIAALDASSLTVRVSITYISLAHDTGYV